MPVPAFTAEQQSELVEATLTAILDEKQVKKEIHAALSNLEVHTCDVFSLVEATL